MTLKVPGSRIARRLLMLASIAAGGGHPMEARSDDPNCYRAAKDRWVTRDTRRRVVRLLRGLASRRAQTKLEAARAQRLREAALRRSLPPDGSYDSDDPLSP